MHPETLGRIYQNYLRCLGLSCYSHNKYVEYLLIAYNLLIICFDLHHAYSEYILVTDSNFDGSSNFDVVLEIAIFEFYKIMRVLLCIRAIFWRKMEGNISKKIQAIDDDFQLKLFFNDKNNSSFFHGIFYKYFWIGDICWNMIVFAYMWYCYDLKESLLSYRFIFTLQAVKAVYWQFLFVIMKIDEKLENLEKCLKINLQRQEQEQQQQQLQETVKHPAEIVNFRKSNECITVSVLALLNDGQTLNNCLFGIGDEVQPYLLQRIWTMNCIYGKLLQLCTTCSSLFGLCVFLMNFLCIWDFTQLIYLLITVLNNGTYPLIAVIYGLYCNIPSLMILILLCWCSEKCSTKAIKISKQLKMSPSHAMFIDDFILQITQNPIKFSAYNFYDLNLKTLFNIFVLVFEFLVIFLQLYFLMRVV